MDRFDEMAVFVAVAERGSFAAAARQLGHSAPTVTRAVAALEQRLGTLLLARTTRSVRLTESGARFLEDARRVLSDLAELEDGPLESGQHLRGALTLTAPQLFGRLFFAPMLRGFLREHPQLRARLLLRDEPVNLQEEGVDVALRIGAAVPDGMSANTVAHVRRILVAAPSLLDAHGIPFHPDQLARWPLITCSIDTQQTAWQFLEGEDAIRVPLAPRLSTSTNDAAIDAAIAGLGLTRVMSYQVADALAAGQLKIVLDSFEPPPLPVRLVVVPERGETPRVMRFVSHAAQALATHPALN